jgi:hypothetical protein
MVAVFEGDERAWSPNADHGTEYGDADGDLWFDACEYLDSTCEQDGDETLWHEPQGLYYIIHL